MPMVGASGAIGGVMGAYILLYPRVHVHMLVFFGFFITTIAVPAVLMLGYWLAVQVLSGFASLGAQGGGVAFWAHIGGFVAGAALIFLFRDAELLRRHPYHGWAPASLADPQLEAGRAVVRISQWRTQVCPQAPLRRTSASDARLVTGGRLPSRSVEL